MGDPPYGHTAVCVECGHQVKLPADKHTVTSTSPDTTALPVEANRATQAKSWRPKLLLLAIPAAFLVGGFLGYAYGASVWFNAGERLATRHLMQIGDLESQIDAANASVRVSDLARQRAERAMLKYQEVSKEDSKLTAIAEGAVRDIYGEVLSEPMWLRDTYKVHRKVDSWIVEGIVLHGKTDRADACFWAVEIVSSNPAAGELVPREYKAKSVIFDLHLHVMSPHGRWVTKGIIPLNGPHNYPKLSFD